MSKTNWLRHDKTQKRQKQITVDETKHKKLKTEQETPTNTGFDLMSS